jgi:hypothetical protein
MDVNPYRPPGVDDEEIVRALVVDESFAAYSKRYARSIWRELVILAFITVLLLANALL